MGDIRREWGSGIAMSDKRARRRGTKEANQDVENKLGGGGGGWFGGCKAEAVWEDQGQEKGNLGEGDA